MQISGVKATSVKAAVLVAMEQKLRTTEGRARYLLRQASVEPALFASYFNQLHRAAELQEPVGRD